MALFGKPAPTSTILTKIVIFFIILMKKVYKKLLCIDYEIFNGIKGSLN